MSRPQGHGRRSGVNRRSYLGAIGTAGVVATAGCISGVLEDNPDGVVLGPQEDQLADSEDLDYPAYGQEFPAFELGDPVTGTTIDTGELDRTALVTGFFAFCPAECGVLINQLAGVQAMADERGLSEEIVFLPITFDPERDDDEQLKENAETWQVDLDIGNWHYLRPEDEHEAEAIVQDRLGIGYERVDGDEEDTRPGVPDYDFLHIVVTFLVNPDGVVERAYRGEEFGDGHNRETVLEDVETVVNAFEE